MSESGWYAKTEAGRQEIADRARRLPAQLRSILLVVDGQKDDDTLQQIVAGVHAPADALAQLQQMGLIRRGGDAPLPPVTAPAAPSASASASNAPPPASAAAVAGALHALADPSAAPVSREAAQRYSRLYDAMSEAVRQYLGLKGYFMQLKIERCSDAAALEALLPELTAALGKAKSPALAARWLQDTLGDDPQ